MALPALLLPVSAPVARADMDGTVCYGCKGGDYIQEMADGRGGGWTGCIYGECRDLDCERELVVKRLTYLEFSTESHVPRHGHANT